MVVLRTVSDVVRDTLNEFTDGIVAALPNILNAVVFLLLVTVLIRVVLWGVRLALGRVYAGEQSLVASLFTTIVGIFLWFGAALTFLKIVGLGDIAASLGSAAGFLALGVSYALSDMIADTVAGVYLLKDPDFNPGDRVTAAGFTGTVSAIELRKSRFDMDDGDTLVVANREVEKRWALESEGRGGTGKSVPEN